MDNAGGERITPRLRLILLSVSGAVMFAAFWVLASVALMPGRDMVYDVRGARYGGPLTWPSRLLDLNHLSRAGLTYTYILLMVILTVGYVAAIFLVRSDTRKGATVLIGGFFIAFALLFVFMPPFLSRDIYSYAFYGRAMTVYHKNPYILIPAARRADLLFPYIGWHFNASVYGPVFNFFSYAIARLAGNSITAYVLGFKMLAALCYAGSLPIVYTLARRVSPGRENFALAVSAWCPMLVMHIVGGGHNDSLMVLLVLGAFLLYRKDHAFLGLVVMLIAVMTKIEAGLALLPYLVLYVRDVRANPLRRAESAVAAVVAVPVLLYIPFWQGTRIFKATGHMSQLYSFSSVPRLLAVQGQKILKHTGFTAAKAQTLSNGAVHLAFLALFALATLYLLTRVKDFRSMIVMSAAIIMIWFLTSSYILPWYLAVGIMVSAIAGWNWLTGFYIAAVSIFLLYHVPDMSVPKILGTPQAGTNLYLSLPFLLILAAMIGYQLRSFWLRRRGAPGGKADSFEVLDEL